MAGPITIGGTAAGPGGSVDFFTFTAPAGTRVVVENQSGDATLFTAIFRDDGTGNPKPGSGVVWACGPSAWCVRQLPGAGKYVLVVAGAHSKGATNFTPTTQAYQVALRKYRFLIDDVLIKLHPSTC